ncbi:MAG: LysR family transcriptional regulator [Gammaproteobacteria bacterium]|nr:LysR family transcriptional regulator [Gammaproteobacteria bacterium]MBI5618639.1 LysR family transcriptional regulator [Gammaproteobacteria bacterium]
MEVFVRVVDTGGFSRAASQLRMPKATVTTLIQRLESRLSVRLLNRTTRRVSVTPDGAAYYDRCVRILAEVAETESALARTQSAPSGRLRVDVGVVLGRRVLVPALPEFFARYPEIHLELCCSDRPVDLMEQGIDCAIRGGDLVDNSLVAQQIGTLQFVLCAAPGYLERHGHPRHPQELLAHRCVNYFSPQTGKLFDWVFTKGGETIKLALKGQLAVNDAEAYLAAGGAGLGIIGMPHFMLGAEQDTPGVVPVLTDWRAEPLPIYVIYPPNRHLSAKVRVFVEWASSLIAARLAG